MALFDKKKRPEPRQAVDQHSAPSGLSDTEPGSIDSTPVFSPAPRQSSESRFVDPVSGPAALNGPNRVLDEPDLAIMSSEIRRLEGKVSKKAATAAVILAGGSGTRLGHDGGKQMLIIHGKPVLTWAIEAFDAAEDVGLIVVVCPKGRLEEYRAQAVEPYNFVTPITFAYAGDVRQESSFNGVEEVPESFEFIAIHDGARPLVMPEMIMRAISQVKGNIDADGAVVGHPAVDTLKVINGNKIMGTPDRSAFWNAQTPQVFRADIIRQAHVSALSDGFVGTDDSSLVERIGGQVVIVQGPRDNLKVTVPEDIATVEAALTARRTAVEED